MGHARNTLGNLGVWLQFHHIQVRTRRACRGAKTLGSERRTVLFTYLAELVNAAFQNSKRFRFMENRPSPAMQMQPWLVLAHPALLLPVTSEFEHGENSRLHLGINRNPNPQLLSEMYPNIIKVYTFSREPWPGLASAVHGAVRELQARRMRLRPVSTLSLRLVLAFCSYPGWRENETSLWLGLGLSSLCLLGFAWPRSWTGHRSHQQQRRRPAEETLLPMASKRRKQAESFEAQQKVPPPLCNLNPAPARRSTVACCGTC